MTSVPFPTFSTDGFLIPAETDIRDGVMADINEAFGGNLNTSPASPQGQLATSIAAMIGACNSMFLLFTNLVDPARTSGRMQEAIARIYFLERIPAQATVVSATVMGLAGVVIPVGALIQDTSGNTYQSLQSATIDSTGTAIVQFANVVTGAIPCPAGTLTTIYTSIPGWDAVTNAADGVLGRDAETPSAFETRRALSVAWNSVGSLPSILGAVLNVEGVVDAYVTENTTRAPIMVGGVTLNANSIYVAVIGGKDADVARAIWSRKGAGCGYTGGTSVIVEDMSAGYAPPFPSYVVLFQRAMDTLISVSVILDPHPLMPSNFADLVRAAVMSAFSGEDGGEPVRIGETLRASRLYAAIYALGPWVRVRSILLGSPNTPDATFVGSISDKTLTVSSILAGALSAGQVVFSGASGFVVGTTIVSQTSGDPGGVGTYQVSATQTVSVANMTAAATVQFETPIHIDQRAATAAALISVSTP